MSLADQVLQLRKTTGLSQQQLANTASVSLTVIDQLEKGQAISASDSSKILSALHSLSQPSSLQREFLANERRREKSNGLENENDGFDF